MIRCACSSTCSQSGATRIRGCMARLFNRAEIPLAPDLRHESALWTAGVECVAGIDEAGGGGLASSCEIDQIGIVPATMLAMRRAVSAMRLAPDHCLVDALHLPGLAVPQSALIKGDARS